MSLKKNTFALLASSLALVVSACSSGSSSSADRESDSSSSGGTSSSSSSSAIVSSSSACDSCVTTSDLMINMNLGKKFGTVLWLTAGTNGLYSLWFVDTASTENSYGTAVTHSDFADGTLSFTSSDGFVYASNLAVGDSIKAFIASGLKLSFSRASDSSLMVSINGATPVTVARATREVNADYLAKVSKIEGTILEWTSGDSVSTYRFYKNGEYVRTGTIKSDLWEAGYYDVHRQHLLCLPVFSKTDGTVATLNSFTAKIVSGGYEFDDSRTYATSSLTANYPDVDLLTAATSWKAKSNDSLQWTLVFSSNSLTASAKTGLTDNTLKEKRTASWGVFGDYLAIQTASCSVVDTKTMTCPQQEIGLLSDVEDSSFTFTNSDTTAEYALPASWTVPEVE